MKIIPLQISLLSLALAALLGGCESPEDKKAYALYANLQGIQNDTDAERLIAEGAPLNQVVGGFYPIHLAASHNNLVLVKLMIERGARVDAGKDGRDFGWNTKGETVTHSFDQAIHYAVQNKHQDVVRYLLSVGADVNAPGGFDHLHDLPFSEKPLLSRSVSCPLDIAARNGDVGMVKLLLSAGARVELSDKNGTDPMHAAASGNSPEVLALLLNAGAKVDGNKADDTPLMQAASSGCAKAVAFLLEHGAKLDSADNQGCQPIHLAAMSGDVDSVTALLRAGAKVDTKANRGGTPLWWVAFSPKSGPEMDAMIRFLCKQGAALNSMEPDGSSLLMMAAALDQTEKVLTLLDCGADINLRAPGSGETAYDVAVRHGKKSMAEFLISRGGKSGRPKSEG